MYACPRCGYRTSALRDYKRHIGRQTACKDLLGSNIQWSELDALLKHELSSKTRTYLCESCGKCFPSSHTKYYHRKKEHGISECDIHVDAKSTEEVFHSLVDKLQTSKLEKGLTLNINFNHNEKITTNNNNNNTNNNVVNNQNQNLTVCAFGEEKYDYLSKDRLTKYFLGRDTGMVKVAEDLHFHKDHPENKNIKMTNKKLSYMQCMNKDGKWEHKDKTRVLDELINDVKNIIDNHVFEHGEDIKRRTNSVLYEKALHFLEEVKMAFDENATPTQERQLKELRNLMRILILNNTD